MPINNYLLYPNLNNYYVFNKLTDSINPFQIYLQNLNQASPFPQLLNKLCQLFLQVIDRKNFQKKSHWSFEVNANLHKNDKDLFPSPKNYESICYEFLINKFNILEESKRKLFFQRIIVLNVYLLEQCLSDLDNFTFPKFKEIWEKFVYVSQYPLQFMNYNIQHTYNLIYESEIYKQPFQLFGEETIRKYKLENYKGKVNPKIFEQFNSIFENLSLEVQIEIIHQNYIFFCELLLFKNFIYSYNHLLKIFFIFSISIISNSPEQIVHIFRKESWIVFKNIEENYNHFFEILEAIRNLKFDLYFK